MEDKSKKSSMVADSQRRSVQTCDSVNLKWLERGGTGGVYPFCSGFAEQLSSRKLLS